MGFRRPFSGESAVRAREYVFANGAVPAHCMEGHGKPYVRHRIVSSKRFEDLVRLPMVMRACHCVIDVLRVGLECRIGQSFDREAQLKARVPQLVSLPIEQASRS